MLSASNETCTRQHNRLLSNILEKCLERYKWSEIVLLQDETVPTGKYDTILFEEPELSTFL